MTIEEIRSLEAAAENIHRLLEARGWSGLMLAEESGVHQSTISRLLNAKHDPGFLKLKKIAAALDTSMDILCGDPVRRKSRVPA